MRHTFINIAALVPEVSQIADQEKSLLDLPAFPKPVQCSPEVIVLGLNPVRLRRTIWSIHSLMQSLKGRTEVAGMALACLLLFVATICQTFPGELTNRLEHPETSRLVRLLSPPYKSLIHKQRQRLENSLFNDHCLGRLQHPAAGKDRKAPKHPSLLVRKQVVALLERGAHGLLTSRRIAGTPGEQRKRLIESC